MDLIMDVYLLLDEMMKLVEDIHRQVYATKEDELLETLVTKRYVMKKEDIFNKFAKEKIRDGYVSAETLHEAALELEKEPGELREEFEKFFRKMREAKII